jgi:hypothetical protein
MSESIWWPDEVWWERKVLPLGFITLSFRQLATIALAFGTAFLVSLPFQFPIAGVSFGGRASAFCIVFGVGYLVSSRRVKLLPVELQVFYLLRRDGVEWLEKKLHQLLGRKELEKKPSVGNEQSPVEMVVNDFKNPLSLAVYDKVKDIQNETRASLFLDNQLRGEDSISPEKPRYRLLYVPLPQDVGNHRLTVRLEGLSSPLVSIDLLIKGRSSEVDGSITRVKLP